VASEMPRRSDFPEYRRCTYCAKLFPEETKMEWEHVFPNSWYSTAPLPSGFEKPQVPSCHSCNNSGHKLEDRLRHRWGSIFEETDADPSRIGLWQRIQDGITPKYPPVTGKKAAELKKRNEAKLKARRALQRSLTVIPVGADMGNVVGSPLGRPALFQKGGVVVLGHGGIKFDPKDTQALGEKLVRGFTRHIWKGAVLDPAQVIDVRMLTTEAQRKNMRDVFSGRTVPVVRREEIGSGSLQYIVAADPEFRYPASIWCFVIWRLIWIRAAISVPMPPGATAT